MCSFVDLLNLAELSVNAAGVVGARHAEPKGSDRHSCLSAGAKRWQGTTCRAPVGYCFNAKVKSAFPDATDTYCLSRTR